MTNEARSPKDQRFFGHLLNDAAATGAWNMAFDEALLEHAVSVGDRVWLRFYQWKEPTLSLGYFQEWARLRTHIAGECAVVRRPTGGGAIMHDRELTYSLVLPPGHGATGDTESLYAVVHESLICSLQTQGIAAHLSGRADVRPDDGQELFMCFQRRTSSDVVLDQGMSERAVGEKICGSAQRRRRGALLMHGSLLLSTSPFAPQIPGIKELTGISAETSVLRASWAERLTAALGWGELSAADVPAGIKVAARKLAREKYAAHGWTRKR